MGSCPLRGAVGDGDLTLSLVLGCGAAMPTLGRPLEAPASPCHRSLPPQSLKPLN